MPPIFIATEKGFYYEPAGIGDILLRPSDLGDQYDNVLALFKSKTKSSFNYEAMNGEEEV